MQKDSKCSAMSTQFSKLIKTGDRQREFNFNQLPNGVDFRYRVDVTDDKGKTMVFSMFKNAEGHWKTAAQSLPIWIHNAEIVLGDAIEQHLSQSV